MVVGALLLGVAAFLWFGRIGPRDLALANLVTAAAAVVWLVVASGFSTPGAVLLVVTAAVLVVLALAELRL